jgi:adenine-specific DNA-methyltransferase
VRRQLAPAVDRHERGLVIGRRYGDDVASVPHNRRKGLGAFYTPPPMAQALVDWAVRDVQDRVLDGSFGGLAFLAAARARLTALGTEEPDVQLYGCDYDREAFGAARPFAAGGATLVRRDFLAVRPGHDLPRVEAVVGNPPYVRYHGWKTSREKGREIAAAHGVQLTRLASSWAPLLIHATDFVAPGGRLAQVLPAELVHAQYADQVLDCVCRRFDRVVVAMFDAHVFPGAQEEVVLLFADGRDQGPAPGVEVVSFDDLDDLSLREEPGDALRVDDEHKLLAGLLNGAALELYDRLRGDRATTLGELASVDIGAVTGANEWFVRPVEAVRGLDGDVARPTISKATHVPGARFGADDLAAMDEAGAPARMLVLEAHHARRKAVRELVAQGEAEGIHTRYKTRIRDPWWVLPASQVVSSPHLFLTYMSSDMPRLVTNEVGALSTNTVHGARLRNGADPAALAAAFYSSLTMLSAELVGRSYGGGVLKLEPSEAERLVVAVPAAGYARMLNDVDRLVRARRYDDLQDLVDRAVLCDGLNVAGEDVGLLRGAINRLRGRRRARARRKAR